MTATARSVLVYSIYALGLGATLILAPGVALPIFGVAAPAEEAIANSDDGPGAMSGTASTR